MSCNVEDGKLVRTIMVWTDGVSFFATSEEPPRIFIHANSLKAVYVGLARSIVTADEQTERTQDET